jgi:polysaccharide biosynthesis/export protein VpsN
MNRILLLIACLFAFAGFASAQVTIASGQAIEIRISGVPQEEMSIVNNTYPVSEQGTIRLPFIGSVRAAGLRPEGLAASIEAAYRSAQIYTHPTIQVLSSSDETLKELTVTVGGYVRNTGPVKYVRGLTLYNAVQAAGGPNEFGAMGRVGLVRNGQRKEYDLRQTKFMNILVEPNDTITVPQKNWLGQ